MKVNFRYESRYETKYKQNFQETIEYILNKKYGDTLTFSELSKILGYNIDLDVELLKFKSQMIKIKNILIEYGYILKSIPGLGYYILKPEHVSSFCYRTYVKRSHRLLDKSLKIINHIDKSGFSDERKEEYNNFNDLNIKLIESTKQKIFDSGYYSRKAFYDKLED